MSADDVEMNTQAYFGSLSYGSFMTHFAPLLPLVFGRLSAVASTESKSKQQTEEDDERSKDKPTGSTSLVPAAFSISAHELQQLLLEVIASEKHNFAPSKGGWGGKRRGAKKKKSQPKKS